MRRTKRGPLAQYALLWPLDAVLAKEHSNVESNEINVTLR